jgi:hypothetical protein
VYSTAGFLFGGDDYRGAKRRAITGKRQVTMLSERHTSDLVGGSGEGEFPELSGLERKIRT